jgi:hypothetical protein
MAYTTYVPPTEETLAQMNAVTDRHFSGFEQFVYEDSPLLKRLKSKNKVRIKGGTQIQWTARIAKLNQSGAVDPREETTWATTDTRQGVMTNWKFYFGKTLAQWDEIMMNKGSEEQLVDLIADKATELKEDFNDSLITDLYASTQAAEKIDSLYTIVGTGSYAGLDPATLGDATRWQSIVEDLSATPAALNIYNDATNSSLASLYRQATFGEKHPTLLITTDEIFNEIEAIFEEYKRLTKDEDTIKLGFDNIRFKNSVIVADKFCPAGTLWGLDEDALELVVHPSYDFKTTPWQEHENWPNAAFKGMSLVCNLKSKRRHTHFMRNGINAVALKGA